MQFVIDEGNDNQFHWRLIGDDGTDLRSPLRASPRRRQRVVPQRWHEQAGADAALKVAGPPRRTA